MDLILIENYYYIKIGPLLSEKFRRNIGFCLRFLSNKIITFISENQMV